MHGSLKRDNKKESDEKKIQNYIQNFKIQRERIKNLFSDTAVYFKS